MTRAGVHEILIIHNQNRYLVTERLGSLVILVPKMPKQELINDIDYKRAMGLGIYFWKLPFWKCRFKKKQWRRL